MDTKPTFQSFRFQFFVGFAACTKIASKSMSKTNLQLDEEANTELQVELSELATRISALVSLYETKGAAAKAAGVDPEQLRRYEAAKSKAPFIVLSRLAAPFGVSLDWLATGEGEMRKVPPPPPPPLNRQLLVDVIEQIEEYLADRRATLPAASKARLIGIFYKAALESEGRLSRETLHELFGLVQPKG